MMTCQRAKVMAITGLLLAFSWGSVGSAGDEAKKSAGDSKEPAASKIVFELLRRTEEAFRPPTAEKFREWSGTLHWLGFSKPANELLARTPPAADEVKKVGLALARSGQYEVAAGLLDRWLAQHPEDRQVLLLRLGCFQMLGMPELAQRRLVEIRRARAKPDEPDGSAMADFLGRLLLMQQTNQLAGLEHNPWSVQFSPAGSVEPYSELPAAEREKIPSTAVPIMCYWLELLPLQPNLWALLGQLEYAAGQVDDALDCFRRAKSLGYTSPRLATYIHLLERRKKEATAAAFAGQSKNAKVAGNNVEAGETEAPAAVPVAMTESSLRTIITVAISSLAVGFLLGTSFRRRDRPST